jgi:hypothetical protein
MMTIMSVEIKAWVAMIGAVTTRHLGQLAHVPWPTIHASVDFSRSALLMPRDTDAG